MKDLLSNNDLQFLAQKKITTETVFNQIDIFKKGINFLSIKSHASVENGILKLNNNEIQELKDFFDSESQKLAILKFVPASGAASRMFKAIFEFINSKSEQLTEELEPVFDGITRFAFYDELNETCNKLYGESIEGLISKKEFKKIAKALLNKEGLNYGSLSKALLAFHAYDEKARTALEEHLVEGALYAKSKDNNVYIHFTVSPEHLEEFMKKVYSVVEGYSKEFNVKYHISYSVQKSSTDTIAVDLENNPFRLDSGELLFRPGGHGALLDNLNALDADLIFIKNIDNVVPDKLKGETITYKKALAGKLLSIREKLFEFASKIERSDSISDEFISEIEKYYIDNLSFQFPGQYEKVDKNKKIDYLKSKINRPIRVCGMVRNEGEPGGGPFLAYNPDGSVSPQVVETTQIDKKNSEQNKHLENATHFNPVDLICSTKNYKGENFNLFDFRDPETGFISQKSSGGKDLKALELPGLWNGAMSDWNTLFVEVPVVTFNPVKTILDLLRKEHQN